jgi:hypothetical protein
MPESGGQERRKKPRITRRLAVRFGTDARMCGGTALDIAEGGLRIETPETFPTNSVVTVFVQFPRHSVRLKARVAWVGGQGSMPTMGLSFTHAEPALAKAYKEWLAEIKLIAQEPAADAPPPGQGPAPASAPAAPTSAATPPPAAAPTPTEPKGPVRRRLETHQGNSYEVLLDPRGGGWRMTIVQLPRQIGVDAPDLEQDFRDYAATEKALREFIRSH